MNRAATYFDFQMEYPIGTIEQLEACELIVIVLVLRHFSLSGMQNTMEIKR